MTDHGLSWTAMDCLLTLNSRCLALLTSFAPCPDCGSCALKLLAASHGVIEDCLSYRLTEEGYASFILTLASLEALMELEEC